MHKITVTDVRSIPADSAFLIDDGKTSILYDSGFAFTGYNVVDNIKAVLGDRNLDYIFLTHSHYDHVLGSVYALKYWPDAKIVAAEYAAKIFSKPTAKALMRNLDRKFAAACNVGEYEDLIDELKVDIPVNDGDIITAGDMEFRIISFPGHTKCSIGFYLQENKLLLGCETLGLYDGNIILPSYLIGYKVALESIEKAQKFDIDNVLIPHGGILDKEQTSFYLKNSGKSVKEISQSLCSILKNGGTKEDAIEFYKQKYYHDKLKEAYPIDAMLLNTGIMIDIIEKELLT